ncbi:MAG: hypothetical protein CM1200mP21_02520 [Candidatus Poseidoniales archaeon]|nr:MAG: hypothetical protein CM1200mP21_02520 [Candidatus Poseidoniales archaeon]
MITGLGSASSLALERGDVMGDSAFFTLSSDYDSAGDQQQAIDKLFLNKLRVVKGRCVLLGVTGSGKTFAMAKVIERLQIPPSHPLAQQNPCSPVVARG